MSPWFLEPLQKCNGIPIATRWRIDQDDRDPVNCTSANASSVFDASTRPGCDVLNLNGVYHTRLSLSEDESPILVALHGVCTETEAHQAIRSIINVQARRCDTAILAR